MYVIIFKIILKFKKKEKKKRCIGLHQNLGLDLNKLTWNNAQHLSR